jgi:multisubunit Na+/H+ antiporter MnhE subunit
VVNYGDQSLVVIGIGTLLLLVGIAAAFLGPVEMYCFYLFSEGGRFHYEGFRFGSFMFGNIAGQIIGYYVIALLCIPLGYGHLKVRRWARTLSLTLLWFWLVVGAPLAVVFFFVLITAKDLSQTAALVAAILLALSYLVVPGLLIRFYRSRNARLTFESKDPGSNWTEKVPIPILVLCSLYLFYSIALHVPIFFNGVFPLFGTFLSGLQGILLLDVSIVYLVFMAWSTFRLRTWAWWGSLIYFGVMTLSSITTLLKSSYAEILAVLNFPPSEIEFLDGVPIQGYHLAVFVGIPLLLTLGAIVLSRRYFSSA